MLLPFLTIVVVIPSSSGGHVPGEALNGTLTLGYLLPWSHDWLVGQSSAPAISLAIREVERRGLLPGYKIEWVIRDTWCAALRGFRMLVDVWSEVQDLDGIIGSACSMACVPVALMTAAWNIPTVSYSCMSSALSDKDAYPTFTRASQPYVNLAPMFNALLDVFGWERVGVLTTNQEVNWYFADAARQVMESQGKTVFFRVFESTSDGNKVIQDSMDRAYYVMNELKLKTRIIFLFVYPYDLRNILIVAHDLGMLNGEYVFASPENTAISALSTSYRPELTNELWNGLITMEPYRPTGSEWDQFAQDVIDEFQEPEWNFMPHLDANAPIHDVPVYAGLIYDSVLLWAHGVNKTLTEGGAPDDGLQVAGNIFGSSIRGVTGQVTIDDAGDRMLDYNILMYQTDTFVPILRWHTDVSEMGYIYPNYSTAGWHGITWAAGQAEVPSGIPVCGWEQEFCPDKPSENIDLILGISSVVIVMGVLTVSVMSAQRYRTRMDMAKTCQLSWSDILRIDHNEEEQHRVGEVYTVTDQSTNHPQSLLSESAQIGKWGDKLVMIHPSENLFGNTSAKEKSQTLSSFLELSHENILHFHGVILESQPQCVITQAATRGTLYDFLRDGSMAIAQDFKMSLLFDIASGMKYLHQSSLGKHGTLSSKCSVIDSKWVCKISSHWSHKVVGKSRKASYSQDSFSNADDLLWTAPEVLREELVTRRADMFSYGIIVQEVLTEGKPYDMNSPQLMPRDIVQRVSQSLTSPYRPHIPDTTCSKSWRQLAQEAWREDPETRPSFEEVLGKLTKINGGKKVNLVDGMAIRLEAHTAHLEELVAERSLELMDEKARVEHILCDLLPRSVYYQMKQGKTVAPESFDMVSMFFSDLVGFTALAAGATPMQIVALLNELYSMFDRIIERYDVYKVATIGDAYIVVSGLPDRNGDRHPGEVAAMALDLRDAVKDFPIKHKPGSHVLMRVGLHSGPCVGAITGFKMPRYLLFGDTVNIGTSIEATGEAKRIHVSSVTAKFLNRDERFDLRARDEEVNVAGFGRMNTWWLVKKHVMLK